jgi:glyoxylase-like metal-dependent hydrolase (beta-lactamase superfamily II)
MLRRITAVFAVALGLFAAAGALATNAVAQEAKREITQIKGDLYRFQNNFHFSVFYVTSEGIVVTDPINAEAAAWLLAELGKRFEQPVKYLILSHDHPDHSSGGEVFVDAGATVIAHARAKEVILGEGRPTAVPDITFEKRLDLNLGGKLVELRYLGKNHSDNSIVMRFPEESVLFAVDFIPVKTVAYRDLNDAYLKGWIKSLRKVEHMDFEILAPGHGKLGDKSDVTLFRNYFSDLYDQVLAAARARKSLEETKASLDLSAYKDMAMFDKWGPLNIEGVYTRIQLNRRGN